MARIRVATDNESSITNGAARSTDVHEIDLLRARPYNQRIDLPLLDEEIVTAYSKTMMISRARWTMSSREKKSKKHRRKF